MKQGKFFSAGKLLLTSEYFILDGALALAVPTKLGQEFIFEETEDQKSTIFWKAYQNNQLWLEAEINYQNWHIVNTNLPEETQFLVKILKEVQGNSKSKLKDNTSYNISTHLQFPSNYGLGSSSTLINNLATWSETDAFKLNHFAFGGSGYDVAVAQQKTPIIFQKSKESANVTRVDFNPPFLEDLLFIHLNTKQNSRDGIALYQSKPKNFKLIEEFSSLTQNILNANTLEDFTTYINLHEEKVSNFIGMPKIKDLHFKDYGGFVKSLGAWGGDFVMASKHGNFLEYFNQKNYKNIYLYKDLIY